MVHVGKSYPIHDALGKATGRTVYAGDMELKGMLHMAVLFSKIPHGFVKKLDYSKAMELPGVVDVLYYGNTCQKEYNRYHSQYRQDLIHTERIFNQHVRFVGDRIAAVVATTEEIARKAVSLIEVEYEEYPFALDAHETLEGKIDNMDERGSVFGPIANEVGTRPENDGSFVEVDTTTHIDRINHMAMETHAAVAEFDSQGELTIYSPNQTVYGIRSFIADLFDMDYNKVRVVKTTMGGSFGGKQEWVLEPVVAAAALRVKRPVKLVYNREETIRSTYCRAPMYFKNKFTFTPDGMLQDVDTDLLLDAGAYLGNSINYARTLGSKFFRTYRYPHETFHAQVALTNTIVSGAFRGWSSPEFNINFEHGMNMAARKLGIDPVELRMKNVAREGDVDISSGVSLGDYKGYQVLELGREKFDWENRKKEIAEFNAKNKRYKRGMGVSLGGHVNGFYPAKPDYTRVDMCVTESGTVRCGVTLHDHGCGTVTAFKMIAAEELGIDVDQVRIQEGDTAVTPQDFVGCFSSRTTYVMGRATQECAKLLKQRIKEHFAEERGCDVADVVLDGMTVYSTKEPDVVYTWSDLVYASQQRYQHEIFASYEHVSKDNPGVCGGHFAYVEVDTYTGMVKILDYLAVHDIGQAINREICIAQTQGASVMGAGAALTEHVHYRPNGVPFANLKDYHLLNSFEAPSVRVELIENHNTEGPFGAKTIGEVCHVPASAAVVGAVNDALQSDMNDLPLTPDKITAYLKNREER